MVKITTLRIWIGISIVWPLLCILMFNRWFFLSPLGLLIAFGMPIAGWTLWWKFYREVAQKLAFNEKFNAAKAVGFLMDLKKRLLN